MTADWNQLIADADAWATDNPTIAPLPGYGPSPRARHELGDTFTLDAAVASFGASNLLTRLVASGLPLPVITVALARAASGAGSTVDNDERCGINSRGLDDFERWLYAYETRNDVNAAPSVSDLPPASARTDGQMRGGLSR